MVLGYPGQWREQKVYAVSTALRLNNLHLAIWLYRWTSGAWRWAGRTLVRYPTAAPPFWRGTSGGDDDASNVPKFELTDNTGSASSVVVRGRGP
jgi:hypothetical protein